ncbi:MAG: hypothetical protein MUF35_00515 [Candidatus Nanopelagicales bacterium]|jgi:hypothetical protein|nr:hypothetical protein [Candidatus Nanopelagicales bacterium]
MARLTATMPVAQAVAAYAAYAALRRHADARRSSGDPRGIGQLMSDERFARLTGASGSAPAVDVEVGLGGVGALAAARRQGPGAGAPT